MPVKPKLVMVSDQMLIALMSSPYFAMLGQLFLNSFIKNYGNGELLLPSKK